VTEDAIYVSQAIRGFVGFDLSCEAAPHAIILLRFRRLLEAHTLPGQLFALFGLAKRVNTYSATAN